MAQGSVRHPARPTRRGHRADAGGSGGAVQGPRRRGVRADSVLARGQPGRRARRNTSYGIPEHGLPQFVALLRSGLKRIPVTPATQTLVETWCQEEAAYFEEYYGRPCTPDGWGDFG